MNFLKKGLIGTLILASIVGTSLTSCKSKSSRKSLEDKVKVEQVMPISESRRTIIHLKQIHESPISSTGRKIKEVVKYNEELYNFLIQNDVKEIYVEGMYPELLDACPPKKIEGFQYSFSPDKLDDEEIYDPEELKDSGYRPAWFRLAAEGKIKIKALERTNLYLNAMNALPNLGVGKATPEQIEDIFDNRENGMLEDLAKASEGKIYVLLGANHHFRNNISEWNKNHPDDQYGLGEVDGR